jgi:hypothetical protein
MLIPKEEKKKFYFKNKAQLRNLHVRQLRINSKNCGFAISGIANLRSLRICDNGMSPRVWRLRVCGLKEIFAYPPLRLAIIGKALFA